jgi:hypothetical protein
MVTDSSGFFAYLIGTNANLVNGTYYQQFYSGVVYNVGNVYTNGVFTPNSTGLWMVAVTAFGADLADHTFLETEVTHAVSAATTNVYIRWDGSGGASGNFSTTWSIPVYVNATSETFRLFVRHGDGGNDVDVWGGLFSFGPYTTRYFSWWGAWKVHQ